jgi:predicted Zn-dependent protease
MAADTAARFPLSPLAIHHYLDLLHQSNQHEAAIAFLRQQSAIQRTQPVYHALLGRAYAALNRKSLQYQSVGEMYALLGARQSAIAQLEMARRANDGDFYTMSEIDARLRELQVEHKRELDMMKEAGGRRSPEEPQRR